MIAPECQQQVPDGVRWIQRAYRPGDLNGALVAVAATNCRDINFQVGREAEKLGIFASICDSKEESTFFFPAICTGGGLISGVVSHGEDHHKTARAAREIRRVLEDVE